MKKLIYLIVAIVILGLVASGCFLSVVPPTEKDEITSLTKAKPADKPPSGAHFNLNIIGKKSDWSAQGSFSNPDRHTMFVPEDIEDYNINHPDNTCYTPSGTPSWAPPGADYDDPREEEFPGITIWMTQCPPESVDCDFAVLDGNAFDDCKLEFQLAPGKYEVWIVAKAKPPKPGTPEEDEYYTDITGWVRYEDEFGTEYVGSNMGILNVKKKFGWQDATDLFYFDTEYGNDLWVFTYLNLLEDDPDYENAAHFWQFDNKGNKLVKVRFYYKED